MREGWKLKTLSEVCEKITDGSHNPPKGKESGRIMLSGRNITESGLDLTKVRYISNDEFEKEDKRTDVKPGDVLLTIVGTIGRSVVYPSGIEKMVFQRSVAILKPNEILDSDFLSKLFNSKEYQDLFESKARGVAQKGIYLKTLRSIPIPIPPLEEQQQIVAILDKAFAAIDQAKTNIERNIENAKELFQSKLNQIFSQTGDGWEEKTLGEVCSVLNGFAFKSKDTISNSNTQLLRMGNLYQNILDLNRKPVFYPDGFSNKYNTYLLKEGDLIMSLTGTVDKTDYGYTVKIPETDVHLLLNQRIMKIDVIDKNILNKDYLRHYLLSPNFLKRLYATASGTRQANLSSRTILTLNISFPKNIQKQREIVFLLEYLNGSKINLENYYQQKLTNLEELKKSILQKAFAGELTEKEIAI
ncbi:restriction endonuclease subunit S [Tenacibaculum sp. Ill]|uniref:restriction endonuclease subunit S n=1 Tax=Tenacibaculum sp. Ill TaxID=3445935 RepID=UPI003D3B0CEB